MARTILIAATGIVVSAVMLGAGFVAGRALPQTAPTVQSQDLDEAAIGRIVRDTLVQNPEIMLEVQTALETQQRERQQETQQTAIAEDSDTIFNAAYDGIVGNPDGKITIVEFYDYNCGYCKRALADMEAVVEADSDVRFVLKEFPILGPDSLQAHVVSMAFRTLLPERYGEFHRRLLGTEGRATSDSAVALAIELGADEAALRREMENPAINEAFTETYAIADKLAITGTPSYVVGDEVVFGALGSEVLAEKVTNLRNCDSATC